MGVYVCVATLVAQVVAVGYLLRQAANWMTAASTRSWWPREETINRWPVARVTPQNDVDRNNLPTRTASRSASCNRGKWKCASRRRRADWNASDSNNIT